MIAPRRYLQEIVLGAGPVSLGDWAIRDPFLARLHAVVCAAAETPAVVGAGDLAGLVRQAILRCHLAANEPSELRVPRIDPWPDVRAWRAHGCNVESAGQRDFLISALPWSPSWLDSGASDVIASAIAEVPRRERHPVEADPAVEAFTGFATYTGGGQREAVRGAFFMPPGGTTVIQLATGAGKTLAFQLPALVFGKAGGLVFVVTPTVALARDQEERFLGLLEHVGLDRRNLGVPLAFHSGLSDDAKRAIAAAIATGRGGSVQVVFASPEAAMGVLRPALFRAAKAGRLSLFAVDEAHIINQWGQLFRPEFQSLAGLRNALLEACPGREDQFGTALLTATLTSPGFEVLRQLFGASPDQVIAEPGLRPEPGYLISTVAGEDERRAQLIEALRLLPRPLILYTTRRGDAEAWFSLLRDDRDGAGLRRIRLVRGGDLSRPAGERILDEWRRGEVDVVVATSAFGLGVDQAHVRSVVHACLPETIDRYYQEVGRAGRDGNASVALLVSTEADVRTARGLRSRLISVERGFERWEAMRRDSQPAGDGVIRVSLDALPSNLHEASGEGAKWNLRTLVLMVRSKLIEFVAKPPPEVVRLEGETEEDFEDRRSALIEETFRSVTVRILDGRHANRDHWDAVVRTKRAELHAADDRATDLVCELRDLRRPLNDMFREVYTVSELNVYPPRFAGSCPVTRAANLAHFAQTPPEVRTLANTGTTVAPRFFEVFNPGPDPGHRAWVGYPPPRNAKELSAIKRLILDLLRYAVTDGVAEICVSTSMVEAKAWVDLLPRSPYKFVARVPVSESSQRSQTGSMRLPRISILDSQDSRAGLIGASSRLDRPFHLIVLPNDVPAQDRPDRRFFDAIEHRSLDTAIQRLERWGS